MKKILKKWEGGAKKHGGLGNSMTSQVQQFVETVVEQVQKIEGGIDKHDGLGNSMAAQIHVWTEPDKRPEAEELEVRRAVEEIARREAEELAARKAVEEVARREANELVAKSEAEHLIKNSTGDFNESWSILNVSLSEDGNKVTIRLKLDEPILVGGDVVEDDGTL